MNGSGKKNIIRDFDRAAKNYDQYALVQRKASDKLFDEIKNHIGDGKIILDAGCGTGYFHELLRKNRKYCELHQMDISPQMCKIAAEYAAPDEYGKTLTINADIENMPFEAECFDIIFSSFTLQWLGDNKKALSEISRCLKHNGKIALNILADGSLFQLRKSMENIGVVPSINEFITIDAFKNAAGDSGFKNINAYSEEIIIYHKTFKDLLHSIKGVGASYKEKRSSGYLGRDYFKKLEEYYIDKYATKEGLPLSWHVIYLMAEK